MSWRQPERTSAAETKDTKATKDTEDRRPRALRPPAFVSFVPSVPLFLIGNSGDLPRIEGLEESARRVDVEPRIPSFDAEEEPVAARQREARHIEDRVIRLRQSVERQHAEHRRERGDENRALEGDRDERRTAVNRIAADVQRIGDDRCPVLEQIAADAAG